MFLVNSRTPLVSATTTSPSPQGRVTGVVPLLPKLRGHFAEFLNRDSLDRLGILYLTTCVGLGYGQLEPHVDAFLGSIGSPDPPPEVGAHQISACMNRGFTYGPAYILRPGQPSPGPATFLRHTC